MLARRLKANPNQSDRIIAESVGVHHGTVGALREKMEGRGEISHATKRTDSKGRKQPGRKASSSKTKANQPQLQGTSESAAPVQETTAVAVLTDPALAPKPVATTISMVPDPGQTAKAESPSGSTAAWPAETTTTSTPPGTVQTAHTESSSASSAGGPAEPAITSPPVGTASTSAKPMTPAAPTRKLPSHQWKELLDRLTDEFRPIENEKERPAR